MKSGTAKTGPVPPTLVKAKCIPEIRNDRVYLVQMALSMDGFDVMNAQCGGPAGKGPCGSCKHIAAL